MRRSLAVLVVGCLTSLAAAAAPRSVDDLAAFGDIKFGQEIVKKRGTVLKARRDDGVTVWSRRVNEETLPAGLEADSLEYQCVGDHLVRIVVTALGDDRKALKKWAIETLGEAAAADGALTWRGARLTATFRGPSSDSYFSPATLTIEEPAALSSAQSAVRATELSAWKSAVTGNDVRLDPRVVRLIGSASEKYAWGAVLKWTGVGMILASVVSLLLSDDVGIANAAPAAIGALSFGIGVAIGSSGDDDLAKVTLPR